MNRASSATGWVRNPVMKSPELDPTQASSYELGWTFNPITGCLNGCEYCYARKLANGRLKQRYLANENICRRPYDLPGRDPAALADPFFPRFWSDRCNRSDILTGGKPKGIFVCDMSDLFGIGIPEDWTYRVLDRCRDMSQHRFYLLTKQPQNLLQFSPFPSNCWVGVTVTERNKLIPALDALDSIQCRIRYLSIEPMLGDFHIPDFDILLGGTLNWLIIGACTGRKAEIASLAKQYSELTPMPYGKIWTLHPKIEWIEEIVKAADKAGTKVFLKDNLGPLIDGNCPDESDLQPNHDSLFRMKHPFLCGGCDGEDCHKCGVIWGLKQELPDANS